MVETVDHTDRIARYLSGRLSASEAVEFEHLCARQPDLVRQLEETLRLRAGLATLRNSGELEAHIQAHPKGDRWLQIGIAASLAVLAIGVALWMDRTHGGALALGGSPSAFRVSSGDTLDTAGTYTFVTSRDAKNMMLQIPLPAIRSALEFRVLPEDQSHQGTYKVTINSLPERGSPRAAGVVDALRADSEGFVHVFADSAALPAGPYELIVTPESVTSVDSMSRFAFTLRPAGN